MHLPDVNFWLALAFQAHAHHPSASTWMQSAERQSCCICRITQMGFLRLATNPKAMLQDTLTMHDAWRVYDQIYSDERVVYADEPADIEVPWRTLTQDQMVVAEL